MERIGWLRGVCVEAEKRGVYICKERSREK